MRFPALFGRGVSARERQLGLKNVRHSGRTQRLSFRKQLRTFMCFTTEEKLSRGASGDKQKRKRGSLSQRLRLTESSEDQSSSLDVMSWLVVRPSTCPPTTQVTVTEAEPNDVPADPTSKTVAEQSCDAVATRKSASSTPDDLDTAISHDPSSLTLSSLDEDQLHAYLKGMFERCRAETLAHGPVEQDADPVAGADCGAFESWTADHKGRLSGNLRAEEKRDEPCADLSASESERRARSRDLRAKCEELVRRHEAMFGPIPTGGRAPVPEQAGDESPLTHYLHQQASELACCEPCVPLVPHSTYLSIPQDRGPPAADGDELAEWRPYYSAGPDGVWKIVLPGQDAPAPAEEAEQSAAGAAEPAPELKPRRLLATFRDRCTALFRHEGNVKGSAADSSGDSSTMPAGPEVKDDVTADEHTERILSETKADSLLNGLNEDDIEQCTTYKHISSPVLIPGHDPESYRGSAFRDWRRFFRWTGSERTASETSLEPWMTTTGSPKVPLSCVDRLVAAVASGDLAARDWLPASCWWGASPLLEAALRAAPAADSAAARLAALLACLRLLGRRLRHGGLLRLVARLDGRSRPRGRQAAWLTRPELPKLFTAAGFGPADMTLWILDSPHEPEEEGRAVLPAADEAVAMREAPRRGQRQTRPAPPAPPKRPLASPPEVARSVEHKKAEVAGPPAVYLVADWEGEPEISPMARSAEQQMAYSVTDPRAPAVVRSKPQPLREESGQSSRAADAATGGEAAHVLIKETDTSRIETPATQFIAGWTATNDSAQDLSGSADQQTIELSLGADVFMPMCSDVCTFLLDDGSDKDRSDPSNVPSSEPNAAYDTYETKRWRQLGSDRSADSPDDTASPAGSPTAASPRADPIAAFDSETELGAHLATSLGGGLAADGGCEPVGQLRNSSVRPIDSEVDIAAVLHEQSGYVTFGESRLPPRAGYQTLPLHEVDSETELGLALPLTDSNRPLAETAHRQVTAYDSEVDMGSLVTSLHGVDSETAMAERVRRLSQRTRPPTPPTPPTPRQSPTPAAFDFETEPDVARPRFAASFPVVGGGQRRECSRGLTPVPERPAPAGTASVARLPAAPVPVDSETEMGVVLRLFEQGMLSSRYFAGVPLSDEAGGELTRLASSDSDIDISLPGGRSEPGSARSERRGQAVETAGPEPSAEPADSARPSLDQIYQHSKQISRGVIAKAVLMLGGVAPSPSLARKGSSPFGACAGLDGVELERESGAEADGAAEEAAAGACDPGRVVPEVSLTTSDGSFVVLFPSHAAEAADRYETEERLVVTVAQRAPAAESRGFQPAEAGLSVSEQEVGGARRRLAGRSRRSPSPRARASETGGLRVLYRADADEPWQPVSPEGLSGLALAAPDPELAAVRWRKNSRGEDGDPEAWSAGQAGEAAPPPPAETQSQDELSKSKAAPPPPFGANSWC